MTTTQAIIKDCKATIKELKGMKKDFDACQKRIEKEIKTLIKLDAKDKKAGKKKPKKTLAVGKRSVGRPRGSIYKSLATRTTRPVGRPRKVQVEQPTVSEE